MIKIWLWLLLASSLVFNNGNDAGSTQGQTGTVVLTITNLEPNKGELRAAIYPENGFLEGKGHLEDHVIEMGDETSMTVTFENVSYGTYALASYQDLDTSHKLSQNRIGIPNEPYGFSGKPGSKWRKPRFSEVAFELDQPKMEFTIELKYWREQ